jgi:hypothetical protein
MALAVESKFRGECLSVPGDRTSHGFDEVTGAETASEE